MESEFLFQERLLRGLGRANRPRGFPRDRSRQNSTKLSPLWLHVERNYYRGYVCGFQAMGLFRSA